MPPRRVAPVKPVDPRLLRYARSTRVFLAAAVVVGTFSAGLIVVQALQPFCGQLLQK